MGSFELPYDLSEDHGSYFATILYWVNSRRYFFLKLLVLAVMGSLKLTPEISSALLLLLTWATALALSDSSAQLASGESSWVWPGGSKTGQQTKAATSSALQNPPIRATEFQQDPPKREPRSGFTFSQFSTTTPILIPTTRTTVATPPPMTTPAPPVTTTRPANCTCVPYYYCDEGQVVADGYGVIDIRNGWPCQSILQVCCRSPKPIPSTVVPPQMTTQPAVTSTAIPGFTPKCGTLNPNGINARILGFKDSETQFGEYPWMAAVLEKKYVLGKPANYFVCGASLVWPSVVVTAAHCVYGKRPGHLIIRLGEWDTQSTNEFYPYQDINGKEIVVHPQYYGGALYNDIALVFLERPAVLAPHIDTICLPSTVPAYDNSSCWATGWGKNSFGYYSGAYQTILKEVELPLVPRTNCQDALRRTNLGAGFTLHPSFLCAGGLKNQDTCVGDGGGPLVCPSVADPWRYVLAGIVSWGVNCGVYGVPAAYVDVSKFRTWIDMTIISRIPTYDSTKLTVTPPLG